MIRAKAFKEELSITTKLEEKIEAKEVDIMELRKAMKMKVCVELLLSLLFNGLSSRPGIEDFSDIADLFWKTCYFRLFLYNPALRKLKMNVSLQRSSFRIYSDTNRIVVCFEIAEM